MMSAALLDPYAARLGNPPIPATEAMLMIFPERRSSIDYAVPVGLGERFGRPGRGHARIVDQHVDRPQGFGDLRNRGLHLRLGADIGLHRERATALGADCRGHGLRAIECARRQRDRRPGAGEPLGQRAADAVASTRHQDDPAHDAPGCALTGL
jgi:hypothetical protein